MAEYKQIKIRIWQDNWFLSLSPEEKLLWFFILTNQNTHVSGLYELPKALISPLTGIKDWEKILLKFIKDDKIYFNNSWIFIKNYEKHQPISNNAKDNVNKAIKKYLEENKEILAKIKTKKNTLKAPTKPLKAPCDTIPEIEVEVEDELEVEPIADKSAGKQINELLKEFEIINPIINYGNKTQRKAIEEMLKKFGYEKLLNTIKFAISIQGKKYTPTITTPIQLKNKLGELLVYYKKKTNNPMIVNI